MTMPRSGPLTTFSVPVLVIGTPFAVAESTEVPSALLVTVKVATPLAFVVALSGEITSALRSLVRTTVAPETSVLAVSLTVTVTVLGTPTVVVIGEATTVERTGLMPLTVRTALLTLVTLSAVATSE
jgi:hypothetical protein